MSELKVSYNGNAKLGKVATLSRKTDASCPDTCGYLDNGCYAQKIERIYPNTGEAWANNLVVHDWQKYRAFFLNAKKKNIPVRLHVAGDFITIKNDKKVVDKKYIAAISKAFLSIPEADRPKIWCYTHVNSKEILKLRDIGITVYASIDSDKDYGRFKKTGFDLFAFGSSVKKGKSTVKVEDTSAGKAPVCWEQLGTKKSCADCGYCISGRGSIVFLNH